MATIIEEINTHESISAYGAARSTVKGSPLSPEELDNIDAYWRASLYLCLGMLYLKENPRVQLNVRVTLGCPLADAEPIILPRLVNASNSQRHHLSKVFQGPPCS